MSATVERRPGGVLAAAVAVASLASLLGLSTAPAAAAVPAARAAAGAVPSEQSFGASSAGGPFNIIAEHSGRCLEVAGNAVLDGTEIVQGDCTGELGERWQLEENVAGGGSFQMVNPNSRKCIGVGTPAGSSDMVLQLADCTPANKVAFTSVDLVAHAWLQSVSVSPAKCAEVRRGAHVPGVPVRLGACSDRPGVKFFTRPANTGNAPAGNGFGGVERVNVGPGDAQTSGELGDKADSNSISGNGRYVAFEAKSAGIVAGDTNNDWDVFVRDLGTGATERVSISSTRVQGNGYSREPSISEDGRYVAFRSKATNLVSGVSDVNNDYDVFVHDRDTGVTELISKNATGAVGSAVSSSPSISADGRYVAFDSSATNLVPGDTNNVRDGFVRDRQSGTIERVTVATGGGQGNGDGGAPVMTPDGRFVVFLSRASNMVSGANHTNNGYDVYLRDRIANSTRRISSAVSGNRGNATSADPAISTDGRYIAFESLASDLLPAGQDTNSASDIFLWDRQSGAVRRISVNADGSQSLTASAEPSMSGDGRYVSFTSASDRMVDYDTNGVPDIFVKDLSDDSVLRASVDHLGRQANGLSEYANLSGNGEQLLFHSDATNLVTGDTNAFRDVFTRPRPRP